MILSIRDVERTVGRHAAAEAFPLNFGFLGKGNASAPESLREQIRAGALGLKLFTPSRP